MDNPAAIHYNYHMNQTKQLPSILGSEPSVKISDKDFNHLMDMAQASGTLEKLNEIYDREMEYMQGAIDDLKTQLKIWKNKIQQYDKFLNVKGLVEECKEFACCTLCK